jgi:hypothetical protein
MRQFENLEMKGMKKKMEGMEEYMSSLQLQLEDWNSMEAIGFSQKQEGLKSLNYSMLLDCSINIGMRFISNIY